MQNGVCKQCGASIAPGSKFCTACGSKTEPPESVEQKTGARTGGPPKGVGMMSVAGGILGNTAFAPESGGEISFAQVFPVAGGMAPNLNLTPVRYLLGGIGRLFSGFTGVHKDKKKIIPAIFLSVVWLLLLLLPKIGLNLPVFKYLSFLTFAKGGTSGGVVGMLGGVLGKGLFAYFILMPFSGGKPLAGVGGGFRKLFGSLAVKNMKTLASVLAGTGAALVACNFLTGDSSIQNSMAGVVAFLLSLRALSNKAGFLRGFLESLAGKFTKGKAPDTSLINCIIAGWAAGFALAAPLSLTGISIICYLVGVLVIIMATLLAIVSGLRKGAAAS